MIATLIYGFRIDPQNNIPDLDDKIGYLSEPALPCGKSPYIVIGGGNTEGGVYLGAQILELMSDYGTDQVDLADVAKAAAAPEALALAAQIDDWLAANASFLRSKGIATPAPRMLIAMDSN